MSNEGGYQGWTNYETWCVNLWLCNEEPYYRDMLALADEYLSEDDDETGDIGDTYALGKAIREYVEELPEASAVLKSASFVSDMLGASLSEVDWDELAGHWLADAKEQNDYMEVS